MTILKALKKLNNKINFEAIIVGKGVLKQSLNNFINQNNLANKIKLVNFLYNPYTIIKQCEEDKKTEEDKSECTDLFFKIK